MSVGTNKRHLASSRPCRGCLHARTRTHWVTNACDLYSMVKGRKSAATQTVLTHQRRVLLVSSNTPRGGITGKPNHNTVLRACLCLPPCVALCNSQSARTPCVPQHLHSHPAATVLYAAALQVLASSAAAARLSKPRTLRSLGDILPDWGLSKHSALWSVC